MDQLVEKTMTSSRGLKYHFFASESTSANNSRPALLFLHGWPDSSALWQFIAPKFHELGYAVVVPDLLGYGGSSKPTDTKLYTFGYQAQDLMEILDSLGIKQVIPVGHDWGSGLAQRVYHFFPERVAALVLLAVAYFPPGKDDSPRDPVAANDHYERIDGYRRFQYQEHFIEDDAPQL